MTVSVVLSFRNEESNIPELVRRLEAALRSAEVDFELVFVNDCSTDGSLRLLADMARDDSHIKVVNLSRRFGTAPGVVAGLAYAKGDAVIYMDSDLQDPPELIPELIAAWRKGYHVVHTTRRSRAGESAFKLWLTNRAYRFLRLISDETPLPVDSGDFKLLDRRAVNEVLKLKEKDPFMRGLVTWVGFKQTQVYYDREKRHSGVTHFPLYNPGPAAKAFVAGMTSFSSLPLVLSLFLGMIVAGGALLYIIAVVIGKFLYPSMTQGWAGIIVTMLVLGGVQLFTQGIIGIYVGRIYNEAKNRPRFIVESTIGCDIDSARTDR